MSIRRRSVLGLHTRPRLVSALLSVAAIGSWRGGSFLDDNDNLSDVTDQEPVRPVALPRRSMVTVVRETAPVAQSAPAAPNEAAPTVTPVGHRPKAA